MTAASQPTPAPRERIPPPRQSSGWSAVLEPAASGPSSLRVTGQYVLYMPPDVGVELRRHEPQGDDPAELQLDRVLKQESPDSSSTLSMGSAMPKTRRVPVSYEEQVSAELERITIAPDGVRITITRAEDGPRPAP